MGIPLSSEQLGVVIVAGVLAFQGLIKELNRRRHPVQKILYGDEAHMALQARVEGQEKLLIELLDLLRSHDASQGRTHDRVIQILTILGERK